MIPEGYRRLDRGETLETSDRFYDPSVDRWFTDTIPSSIVGQPYDGSGCCLRLSVVNPRVNKYSIAMKLKKRWKK